MLFCVDDNFGMMFNNRRQSRDSVLIERVLELTGTSRLLMCDYSSALFVGSAKQSIVDDNYLDGITSFISRYKSILLLVWFKHLDEGDALAYFHGQINLEELIDDIDYHLKDILSLTELDQYCLDNHLYVF